MSKDHQVVCIHRWTCVHIWWSFVGNVFSYCKWNWFLYWWYEYISLPKWPYKDWTNIATKSSFDSAHKWTSC